MAFEIRYYNAQNKDDIEFVTEFQCFWDTLYIQWSSEAHDVLVIQIYAWSKI